MPSSAGRTRCPTANTCCPLRRSSPAKRRFWPALVTAPAAMRTPVASSVARSCITTVSAPAGITAPVKMRTHSPAAQGQGRRLPGEGLACAPQHGLAARREIGEAQRVAVHRRVVVAGHVEGRDHVGGEDPAQRGPDRDALHGGHRMEKGPDQRPRPVDGHRVGIVVVGAGGLAQGLGLGHGVEVRCGQRRVERRAPIVAARAASPVAVRISAARPPRARRPC